MPNTKLINYGIHTEQCDLRAHVCVLARAVYIFRPQAALAAVNVRALGNQAGHKQVHTGDLVTATGYTIPLEEIEGIIPVHLPTGWLSHDPRATAFITIHPQMSTTIKGQKAEKIVRALVLHNMFPMAYRTLQQMSDSQNQLSGIDLTVTGPKIQVKCDFAGGEQSRGGTGNLFIQLTECNPYHMT
jgi:hypothetical protein